MLQRHAQNFWQAYLHQLRTRPVVVKACTSCTTFSLTDVLAQQRELSHGLMEGYSPRRTARNGLFGLLWLGPMNHIVWGRTPLGLEYWFPGSSWRAVFSRVAVDQITNMPLNMIVFLAWPALLTGEGINAALRNVRGSFLDGYLFALSIWPFVHPLSFRYVPLEHRLLVLNFCSLGVFSYATWVAERNAERERSAQHGGSASSMASSVGSAPALGASRLCRSKST